MKQTKFNVVHIFIISIGCFIVSCTSATVRNTDDDRIKNVGKPMDDSLCCNISKSWISNPIEVKRDDGTVVDYYVCNKDENRPIRDLLVIIQGSDCNSVRRISAVDKLARVYGEADILVVEKYGITKELSYNNEPERADCPPIYLSNDNPHQRVRDLDRVLTVLRDNLHYERIIVIGGSEGAVVANLLTNSANYINAAVLLGGGGRFFLNDVIHSMKCSISSEEELNRNINGFIEFSKQILTMEPFEINMSNHGYRWWHTVLSIDQQESLEQIMTPVLIVQGGADNSASPEETTKMVEGLKSKGKTNIDYYLYPDFDHSLNLSLSEGSSDKVIDDIRQWLLKVLS